MSAAPETGAETPPPGAPAPPAPREAVRRVVVGPEDVVQRGSGESGGRPRSLLHLVGFVFGLAAALLAGLLAAGALVVMALTRG